MKKYILSILLMTSMFWIYSCMDEVEDTTAGHNFVMDFTTTRSGEPSVADLIPNMRLFTFTESARMFHNEVLNITRTATKLTAKVETGKWNMTMVSSPESFTLIAPNTAMAMDNLPMYVYQPATTNGKSTSAPELFFQNKLTPQITAGAMSTMDARLNRVVAKVEIVIRKATPNFNMSGNHRIELHDVPSTISYTGKLLPSAVNPALISGALKSPVTLVNSTVYNGFLESQPIEFIIPAHQGADFLETTPEDVTGKHMSITVDLERAGGGSRFTKTEVIDKVVLCNRILRVYVDVNDGVSFETEILPWERIDINANVGTGYQNWLYVKKGATGSGLSWSDPLSDITTAITKAAALKSVGKTVNGILVAGGSDTSMLYNEGFTVPAGIRIFGGWKGDVGTELLPMDVNAPYTSADRDLKMYKARIATGTGSIQLTNAGTVLDGFVVSGSGSSSVSGLVTVSNATAWVNAIEIDRQTSLTTEYALSVQDGTATNMLVSRNNKPGVYVGSGAKLINATIVENNDRSHCFGTMLNCVYWGNTGLLADFPGSTVQHCAVDLGGVTGMIYPLDEVNDTWFTASNVIPGPHFNLDANLAEPRYAAGTAKPNRSPILRRGNKAAFDNNLPVILADAYKKDINGNIRYHTAIDGATQVVDVGCYEDGTHAGFQLKWATDKVYVSSKQGYFSQLPLLLPANEDADINIEVAWSVTVQGGSLTGCSFDGSVINDVTTGSNTGSGSGVMVGMVQFTPTVEYTANAERLLGTITISTQLGTYLSNENLQVWQTSGLQYKWTQGYVGSFHRNNERGARFIYGTNQFGGNWTVRIFSGLDWIKIDTNEKNYGTDITDANEGTTPSGGYYKEVEEIWGGAVSGTGDIKFRIGMKSKNTTSKPRYGLIILTRTGGVSYFFVRQGEEPDYMYRTQDIRPVNGARTVSYVQKFSPYNLRDPQGRVSTTGTDLGTRGGGFTQYPTQLGYYFKSNTTVGYLYGTAKSISASTGSSTWNTAREVCPPGYRHASQLEFVNSLYYDVANTATGMVDPTGPEALQNYEAGAYADGWYDQLLTSKTTTYANVTVGSGVGYARKGILIVSHYNYASIFFPAAGRMSSNGSMTNADYVMNHTNNYRNTHWGQTKDYETPTAADRYKHGGHIGMNCTTIGTSYAAPVRCVKE